MKVGVGIGPLWIPTVITSGLCALSFELPPRLGAPTGQGCSAQLLVQCVWPGQGRVGSRC